MAASPTGHVVVVPQPLATRLEQMVEQGEFPSFERAAVAMIQLGIAHVDGRVVPPSAGPAPPSVTRDFPPPGPVGAPPSPPSSAQESSAARRAGGR